MPLISFIIACAIQSAQFTVSETSNYQTSNNPVSLLLSAPKGSVFAYDLNATTTVGKMSAKLTMRMDMKVVAVEKSGLRKFENKAHSGQFVQGDNTVDIPTTVTHSMVKPNGVLVSSEPPTPDPGQRRSRRMMQITVSDKPLAVGESWTWKEPASELNAQVAATGKGTLNSVETKNGVRCARVTIRITESSGAEPMVSTMLAWISLEDGMLITNDVKITNFAVSPTQVGSLHMTVKRTKA